MSSKKSKLLKSFFLKDLEKEDASHDEFQEALKSDLLSKKEKRKIIFNLNEIGTKKISDSVLKNTDDNKDSE